MDAYWRDGEATLYLGEMAKVCGGFPNTKSIKSARGEATNKGELCFSKFNEVEKYECGYSDSGSASRYFYCAKASKKDRDEGLESFNATAGHTKGNGLDRVCEFCGVSQLTPELCHCEIKSWVAKPRRNIHPTVKPTELMQYLIRLVTPKGGVVLDCFNGSGSTGKATMYENNERNADYKYVGVDIEKDYLEISKARIKYAKSKRR